MIVIDILFLIYSPIVSLTYLKFLLYKKRMIYLYFLYGLILDFIFLNYFFLNTLFLFILYFLMHKKKHYGMTLFLFACIFLLVVNCVFSLNFKYMFSYYFFISVLINTIYYKLSDFFNI